MIQIKSLDMINPWHAHFSAAPQMLSAATPGELSGQSQAWAFSHIFLIAAKYGGFVFSFFVMTRKSSRQINSIVVFLHFFGHHRPNTTLIEKS